MNITRVQRGDTVRLTVQFRNWAGQAVDPDTVTVKIYDYSLKEIKQELLGPTAKLGIGSYYYDFTPTMDGTYYYEFVGQTEGTPALRRGVFEVRFI